MNAMLVAQGGQPIVLMMDGEKVGRVVRNADRENAADGFQPVNTGEDQ